jgi:hypothetical protein
LSQKLTNTHIGNLHGLLPVLHRSDRWPAPVKPMTPVRPVDRACQAGGYSNRTTNVPESLNDLSRPWNKNTPKTKPARKKNPSQNQAKHLQIRQELTSINTTQRHTEQETHQRQIPQKAHIGQTSHAWASRDEQHPRVNSSKSNSRSLDSLHGSEEDFGDSRNTSWALHSQVMVHQTSLNQEESKDFHQELHKP